MESKKECFDKLIKEIESDIIAKARSFNIKGMNDEKLKRCEKCFNLVEERTKVCQMKWNNPETNEWEICYGTKFVDDNPISNDLKLHLWSKYEQFDPSKSGFRTWANWEMRGRIFNLLKKSRKDQVKNKDDIWVSRVITQTQLQKQRGGGEDIYNGGFGNEGKSGKEFGINELENLGSQDSQLEETIDSIDNEILFKRAKLTEEEKTIYQLWQQEFPLRKIGEQLNFSKSKVDQVLKSALAKVKKIKELERQEELED